MTNPNQELLDFAVENIEVWNNEFTHLRSDSSLSPLFFTEGSSWEAGGYRWGCTNDRYRTIGDGSFKTNTPQVISKEEYLEAKDIGKPLQRDKEYSVKLTGEELVLLEMLTGRTNGDQLYLAYKKFNKLVGGSEISLNYADLPRIDIQKVAAVIKAKLDLVFAPPVIPETEDARKLRELKEQHAILGEKIKAMEVK